MRSRPIIWSIISLLCLAGAYYFWQLGEERAGRKVPAAPVQTNQSARSPQTRFQPADPPRSPILAPPQIQQPGQTNPTPAEVAAAKRAERLRYRLANTTGTIGELVRNDRAILLENALIDTAQPISLPIPTHLRSKGDPGSYIVQSRGPIDDEFRALLKQVGAEIVSYIPNNAYLVRASASMVRQLEASGQTQPVLAYEPPYKLRWPLLKYAVDGTPLEKGSALNILLFSDTSETTIEQLERRGVRIMARDRSPFGLVLKVVSPEDALVDIAGLSGVQGVELLHRRVPANDMSRVTMSVAPNTVTLTNYLGLDGTGVKVNVNDGGVDATHPDLTVLRVTGDALTDTGGHGTHVAGIIASSGLNDGDPSGPMVSTNASGSVTNADFRGMAPMASILSLGIDFSTPFTPDSYLQETAAEDPDVFISNNSWGSAVDSGYDLTAASYDAAVRDALPMVSGSRPLLYVFSAGNNGVGQDNGQGGVADTVSAPATAKNVITVGATELGRFITNEFGINGITNDYFFDRTDGTNQVAAFSGRGNVGIGIEGDFGRFKPDVVAPGTFVVSTRSQQWNEDAYYNPSNSLFSIVFNVTVDPGSRFDDFVFVPDSAVEFEITLDNLTTQLELPTLPIYAKDGSVPGLGDFRGNNQISISFPPDQNNTFWYYTVRNPTTAPVTFDVILRIVVVNDKSALETLRLLNDRLGTLYRYESGTSMSAPAVSGMLALMEQFFKDRAGGRVSPALMKAMAINGARSMPGYDFQVQNSINLQGWGLVNLTNSLPFAVSNYASHADGPIHIYDQSPEEALATGQSRTRNIKLQNNATRNQPLRVTLVWTDPPGNPAAGVKLVNDLDLVVTNLDTGEVYYGNDFGAGPPFSQARDANEPAVLDLVNNVENVYIPAVLRTNYAITVVGRRVNVSAVSSNLSWNVAQDYALVIASGDGRNANLINITPDVSPPASAETPLSTVVTNGFNDAPGTVGNVLLGQHVGENAPLLGTDTIPVTGFDPNAAMTIGMTNQWHFYIFTNDLVLTNASAPTNYVAFVTFLSQTLSIPREGVFEQSLGNATREEADIDLYVSTNAAFTNLVPAEIAIASKSLLRGGTEVLTFTNEAGSGQVYYIGVKAEDRQAAEYGFLAVASDQPFSTEDDQGVTIRALPVPTVIPDGTPRNPGAALLFGIAVSPEKARRVVVTNIIGHESLGDLLGNLSHNREFAVLNNHTDGNGTTNQMLIYEDNGEGDIFGSQSSDGPGSLQNFIGENIAGLWLLSMVDNAPFQKGTVRQATFRVDKQLDFDNGAAITLQPGQLFRYSFDVPVEAISLTNFVDNTTGVGAQPIQIFVRRDLPPVVVLDTSITNDIADKADIMDPPSDLLTVDKTDNPPLNAGRYHFALFNPPANSAQNLIIRIKLGLNSNPIQPVRSSSTGFEPVLDVAVTNSTIVVTNDRLIATVDVGLRIDHPRIADLAITLVSPSGTRVLLMENRGGLNNGGAGTSLLYTNVVPQNSDGGFLVETNIMNAGQNQGTLIIDYNFFCVPDRMTVYYDGAQIFDSGLINNGCPTGPSDRFVLDFGPGLSTDLTIVMNEGNNTDTNTAWEYTASVITRAFTYLNFTENTNLTITPIKFALPPFNGASSGSVAFTNSFEGAMGIYTNGQTFDVWTVTTNQVAVTNDPPPADSGSQFLVLGEGHIQTTISSTIAGRRYLLNYAYRAGYLQEDLGPADDLVAWWQGEDNAIDIVGGHNGTLANGGYVNGLVNRAFSFPGVSGRVRIPYSPALAPNNYTIEAWINPMAQISNPQNQTVIFGQSFGHIQLVARTGTTGVFVALQFGINQSTFYWVQSTNEIPLGSFTHVAGSWDGTTLRLYINGALNNQSTPGAIPDDPGCDFFIGGFDDPVPGYCQVSPSQFFNGVIDEVSLYKRALTLSEIQAIYGIGAAGKCAMATPPAICSGVIAGPAVNPANGHRYFLLNSNNWTGSEGWANAMGSHLVTINDAAENAWILNNIAVHNGIVRDLWIGLNDIALEGTFVWTSGEPVTYTNWEPGGQPDNGTGGTAGLEHYGQFYSGDAGFPWQPGWFAGGWNDYINSIMDYNHPAGPRTFNGVVELPAVPGLAQVSVQGLTATFSGDTNWQTGTLAFIAQQSGTPLDVRGLSNGVAMDSFSLVELPQGLYYLPEESLEILKGENARGEWRLELWDNRAGAPVPAGALQSWQLSFVFQDTIPQAAFTNTICGGVITNLSITVPANAAFASNVLVSATGPVNVFFNQTGPATGSVPPDYQLLTQVTNGTFVLTPFTTPPLVPGATYNIGVQNLGTNCVTFVYKVAFGFSFPFPAFPGAEGPGIGAWGGRGGDVYHVVNLNDSGPGSLRYGITNATSRRTIVFDISGTINLLSDLEITNHFMTIAGQTAPGDGITLKGRLTSVQNTHDVQVRFLRFRPGDTNCPTFQDDSFHFDFASNCIVDHVSASWSIDEVLSATDSTNITVQWSMITESLSNSCHVSGPHGFGSLLRYGHGSLGFHHNLYAHNSSRNPRLGDNLSLDFVNNVIYNWGYLAGYSENDIADNPAGFTNRLNYVGNYLIAGTNTTSPNTAFDGGSLNTWIYQTGNLIDSDTDGVLDGLDTGFGMFTNLYTPVATRFNSLPLVTTYTAAEAYERVLAFGGAWQNRDTVDLRLANDVRSQTNHIIDSQNEVGGWPALASLAPFPDSDRDGMPDFWEATLDLDPLVAGNNNDRDGDGYTDLEEHLNWLGVPHALVLHDSSVDVDLRKVTGNTGNLAFNVFNGTNGTVILLTNGYTARFTPTPAYTGFASFGFTATNLVTTNRFGPVPVSVLVSTVEPFTDFTLRIIRWEFVTNSFCITWTSVPGSNYVVQAKPALSDTNWDVVSPVITATNIETTWCLPLPSPYHFFRVAGLALGTVLPPPGIITLTNGVPYSNTNPGGSDTNDYYLYTVSSNAARAQFEVYETTADVTLVARKGFPPLPDLITYDHISANNGTNDELILVFTNSTPPLSQGDWYLTVVNVSGSPASYTIKATEYPTTGTNLNETIVISPTQVCITWDSLVGAHYVVQGKINLADPAWDNVSSTITATNTQMTYCVPLPSPYFFFRVIEGLALQPSVVPDPFSGVTVGPGGVTLTWNAPTNQQFEVQWTASILSPINWNAFTNVVTSTTGVFTFTDDGSQTGGLGATRFYRRLLLP